MEVSDAKGNVVDRRRVQKASVDTTTDNVIMTINGQQYSSANLISIDKTACPDGSWPHPPPPTPHLNHAIIPRKHKQLKPNTRFFRIRSSRFNQKIPI